MARTRARAAAAITIALATHGVAFAVIPQPARSVRHVVPPAATSASLPPSAELEVTWIQLSPHAEALELGSSQRTSSGRPDTSSSKRPTSMQPTSTLGSSGQRSSGSSQLSEQSTGSSPERPGGTGPGRTSGGRSPWMDLRRGQDPDGRGRNPLGLSGRMIEREEVADPLRDPTVPATGLLEPSGGGRHRIDRGTFVAHVAPDGRVHFKDKRNLQHQFTSIENVKKVLRESGPMGLLRIDFDVNDALMRSYVGDPYASEKLAILDATREERFQIGVQHRAAQLARTDEFMRGNLARAWQLSTLAARKEALFELWDEAEESADDRDPGERARRAVIGFIRARLPAGHADAFTAAELAAFDARRESKRAFAPYD